MRPKFVPHAALHEERELRKAAERRAQLLEERTNLVLEAMRAGAPAAAAPAAAAPAAAPLPDFDKDPNGHIRGVLRQQEELLRTLTAVAVNQQQAGRQAAAVTEARERIAALEQDFARETPDYGEARRFTIEAREPPAGRDRPSRSRRAPAHRRPRGAHDRRERHADGPEPGGRRLRAGQVDGLPEAGRGGGAGGAHRQRDRRPAPGRRARFDARQRPGAAQC
ncbi:MAG: hypothetical protein WDO24_23415 [Pseudomonadota bacterium]